MCKAGTIGLVAQVCPNVATRGKGLPATSVCQILNFNTLFRRIGVKLYNNIIQHTAWHEFLSGRLCKSEKVSFIVEIFDSKIKLT